MIVQNTNYVLDQASGGLGVWVVNASDLRQTINCVSHLR